MIIFDVILLIILTVFVVWGLFAGFIEALGSLVGIVLGIIVAGKYYIVFFGWFDCFLPLGDRTLKVIAFLIIFILTAKLVGLLFFIIDKIFKLISIIPFLKTINRLLGAILGLAEGVFIAGGCVYIISKYPINLWFENSLLNSKLSPILLKFFHPLVALLPKILQEIKSLI
ncbi:MAG: CvpA family protein [Patescibacteria group bacterium]|nr:CvpA family protein [Patescibacteria group bacterium]